MILCPANPDIGQYFYFRILFQHGICSNYQSYLEMKVQPRPAEQTWPGYTSVSRRDGHAHRSPEIPLSLAVPVAVNLMLFWVPLPEKLVPLQVTLLTT